MHVDIGIPLYTAFHIAAPQYYMTITTTAYVAGTKNSYLILRPPGIHVASDIGAQD